MDHGLLTPVRAVSHYEFHFRDSQTCRLQRAPAVGWVVLVFYLQFRLIYILLMLNKLFLEEHVKY